MATVTDAFVYSRTNIGGFYFDAYISIEHTSSLKITSHPVETGASVVDHSYVEPKKVTLQIMMSDAASSRKKNQFRSGRSRSISAYESLLYIQESRSPVNVYTRLATYSNMLISNLKATDNADSAEGLEAEITLVEIPVATLKTVRISVDKQITNTTNSGTLEVSKSSDYVNKTLLNQLLGTVY